MTMHDFFATSPRGLEALLAEELTALGGEQVKAVAGGVHFKGDWLCAARANRCSRLASRILWRLRQTPYRTEQDVYRAAQALPWGSGLTRHRPSRSACRHKSARCPVWTS